jgi:hypothetical protein
VRKVVPGEVVVNVIVSLVDVVGWVVVAVVVVNVSVPDVEVVS